MSHRSLLGGALLLALVPACTIAHTGTSEGASDATLSCFEVLQCVSDCPESDADACSDACIARARTRSQGATEALRACLVDHACADAACINSKCQGELDACVADAPDPGEPPTSTPPTGSVPPNLVGTWSSVGTSTGTSFTFEADGSTVNVLQVNTSLGSCTYKTSVASSGVTTATADTLVYHRKSGTQTLDKCGTTSGSSLAAADLTYRYAITSDQGTPTLTLHVVNADGTVDSYATVLHR